MVDCCMGQITIQQAFDLGLQHHRAGRLRQAEEIYRLILTQSPRQIDDAAAAYRGAIGHGRSLSIAWRLWPARAARPFTASRKAKRAGRRMSPGRACGWPTSDPNSTILPTRRR
jgi:hypothetical protein